MAYVHQCDICGRIMKDHVDGQCILYKYDTCRSSLKNEKKLDLCFDCLRALTGFLQLRRKMCDYDRQQSENTEQNETEGSEQ